MWKSSGYYMFKFLAIFIATTVLAYGCWLMPNLGSGNQEGIPGKIRSVSYSPFRRGQSPETGVFPSTKEMEADIVQLSNYVQNIRIYSGTNALGEIPQMAKKHGLTVWLGAWLDSNHETNLTEIKALIELANRYPKTVVRVIIGNENLLRMDITPAQLKEYLILVKASIKQPVSYADGWEYWLDHAEIANAVDIITVHILPYWEQTPKKVDELGMHIEGILKEVGSRYPNKPIAIGEVGWPSFGRSRGEAVPGVHEQAKLVRQVDELAQKMHLDYNIVEAFDQPWKGLTEGSAGAYWGVFTVDREPKHVQGAQGGRYLNWQQWFLASTLGAFLFSITIVSTVKQVVGIKKLFGVSVLSHILMSLIVFSGLYLNFTQASWVSWVIIPIQLCFTYLLLRDMTIDPQEKKQGTTTKDVLAFIRPEKTVKKEKPSVITLLYFIFTYIGIVVLWGMVFQSRFRDFPIVIFLLPVLGVWLSAFFSPHSTGGLWGAVLRNLNLQNKVSKNTIKQQIHLFREEAFISAILCLGAVLVVIGEGFDNLEAIMFSLTFIGLTSPYLGVLWLRK